MALQIGKAVAPAKTACCLSSAAQACRQADGCPGDQRKEQQGNQKTANDPAPQNEIAGNPEHDANQGHQSQSITA